jgi:hypothetical protein
MAVDESGISPVQTLSRLIAGNERYLKGTSSPTPLHDPAARHNEWTSALSAAICNRSRLQ